MTVRDDQVVAIMASVIFSTNFTAGVDYAVTKAIAIKKAVEEKMIESGNR